MGEWINSFFGFHKVQNIGTYSGFPHFHDNITNNTLRFMVEKVQSKLYRWDARQLSLQENYSCAIFIIINFELLHTVDDDT